MSRDDVWVVELVGRVVTRPLRQQGRSLDHVVDVLRRHVGTTVDRRNDVDLGAERSHDLEALLRKAVGHHDQCLIPLRLADERERRTGTPTRVLDDSVAPRNQPITLRALDHRERHTVLHRARRIAIFELEPHLGAIPGHAVTQPDDGCVPDRFEDGMHAVCVPSAPRPARSLASRRYCNARDGVDSTRSTACHDTHGVSPPASSPLGVPLSAATIVERIEGAAEVDALGSQPCVTLISSSTSVPPPRRSFIVPLYCARAGRRRESSVGARRHRYPPAAAHCSARPRFVNDLRRRPN